MEKKTVFGCVNEDALVTLFIEDSHLLEAGPSYELNLPTDEEEIDELNDLLEGEAKIVDYESTIGGKVHERESLWKLNEILTEIQEDIDANEYDEYFCSDYFDLFYSDITSFDTECARDCWKMPFSDYSFGGSYSELGEIYADETDLFGLYDLPVGNALERYFDYEAYGRDLVLNGDFYIGTHYYIGGIY